MGRERGGADPQRRGRRGLAGAGRLPRLAARDWIPIVPWPADLQARLVRAVNEALFQLYARHALAVGFDLGPRSARLGIAPLPPDRKPELEVKAATYHDLRLRRGARRLAALLTLDV
jgi:hypothetical protein